jgi:hypothetical protein
MVQQCQEVLPICVDGSVVVIAKWTMCVRGAGGRGRESIIGGGAGWGRGWEGKAGMYFVTRWQG